MLSNNVRNDARAIWQAGVDAVSSERLVRNVITRGADRLSICGHDFDTKHINRIAVVGAGKAGAGMAAAFEECVDEKMLEEKGAGWINVPADCVRQLETIHLHSARPAGVNEPTGEGVAGSMKILELVSTLGPNDVCVVLLSGGGSALLPAPIPEISLEEKQAVTRFLMHAGATINELNCVRKRLSRIKGGNLARATKAGTIVCLIISDVIGDPLDVIASGPTIADPATDADAIAVLENYAPDGNGVPASIMNYLHDAAKNLRAADPLPDNVFNHVIGNNAVAVQAAAAKADELGYTVVNLGADHAGIAREIGADLAERCQKIRDHGEPVSPPACIISGGEPVVHLVKTGRPQIGGRNQELALSGLARLWDDGMRDIVLLSAGTDGEDGPTDAAGAIADSATIKLAESSGLSPHEFLAVNNSYAFFDQIGGLLKTGPTHTNVMDLRVAVIGIPDQQRVQK